MSALKLFNGSKLTLRFFVIFLTYSLAVIVIIIIAVAIVTSREAPPPEMPHENFMEFEKNNMKSIAYNLSMFYGKHGSFDKLKDNPDLLFKRKLPAPHDAPPNRDHDRFFIHKTVLLDSDGNLVFGKDKDAKMLFSRVLKYNGEKIGTLSIKAREMIPPPLKKLFTEIGLALIFVAVIAIAISFLIANFLSKYFLLPVSKLANATKKFSEYDFSSRITLDRKDEIGMLAKDFNEMADRLDKYEKMRKQWIADIAHELRTPLSIMQAEIEAVQDSVWPLSMKTMDHLHGEIIYLAKTVNELHLLSVAESKGLTLNLEEISVYSLLNDAAERFKEKFKSAGIGFESEPYKYSNIFVLADAYLLRTVVNNLMENTLRYTDKPGQLNVNSYKEDSMAVIVFDDTPPAVPEEYIDRIFDRLFRVDSSRSRKHGGSGLGLATCKTHIEALNGTIEGAASPLGGLRIIIKIPLYKGESHGKRKNFDS